MPSFPKKKSANFATTQWTEIFQAAQAGPQGRDALSRLCERYWYPLYAFLRRSGHHAHDAQDHVQSFFIELLSRKTWTLANQGRGKFRTFLLTACQNHVRNRLREGRAVKRGGNENILSFSLRSGEERYVAERSRASDPASLFDHRWAMTLIETALGRLGQEMTASGRGKRFEVLRPLVAPTADAPSYAEIARRLDTTEGNVKVAVHRLRRKFADILRAEVGATVSPEQVDDEITELLEAISL